MESAAEVLATHRLPSGSVWLLIRREPAGDWHAQVVGADTDAGALLPSRAEAGRYLLRRFGEMYPDHVCTDRCRAGLGVEAG